MSSLPSASALLPLPLPRLALALLGCLAVTAPARTGPLAEGPRPADPARPPTTSQGIAAQEGAALLDRLAEERWQQMLAESLALRLRHGLPAGDLPDLSFEEASRRAAAAEEMLRRLAEIDPESLDHQRWLSHRVLEWEARQTVEGLPWFWHRFQVTPYTWSFTGILQAFAGFGFATPEDGQEYLRLLGQLPRVAQQLQANLETQREKGIVLPRAAIDLAAATFRGLAGPPPVSPFQVASERLVGLDPGPAQELQAEVGRVIEERARLEVACNCGSQ